MANLTDGTNLTGTITLSKATGTKVTLDTDHKYITKDIELTIDAPTSTVTSSGATVSYTSGWVNAGSTTVTDANLIAANIKKDVSIFGVTGTLVGGGVIISDTTDTNGGTIRTITATEDPIMLTTKTITSNGTYSASSDNVDGYSSVTVNVASGLLTTIVIPQQTLSISSEYTYINNYNEELIIGESYIITIDGVSETVTAIDDDHPTIYFNTDIYFVYANGSMLIGLENSSDYGSHTFKVEKVITNSSSPTLQAKTNITPTTSSQTITADTGYDGLSSVQVNGDANLVAANIKSGVSIFDVTGNYAGGSVSLQVKTNINPSTSSQTITADNGYDGLSSVQINAMPSLTLPTSASASATSGYTLKATISPSTSDQYINIGTGYNTTTSYYKISAMSTMTLPTSAAASATSGYTSKATISRSTSDQYINIPTGYNSAGAYYKINAVANGSATGPSTLSGSSATVSTGTNTITLTKTGVSTTPTVSAGYVSSATSSTATVTLTASVTTKAATTYHPSTSDQTISSGTYTTGTQTIKAVTVSGLSASNIISGVTVKIGDSTDDDCVTSVSGSVVIQHYYTGSSAPSNATGVNGDIYLKTS